MENNPSLPDLLFVALHYHFEMRQKLFVADESTLFVWPDH
jgi:hypothetical protein